MGVDKAGRSGGSASTRSRGADREEKTRKSDKSEGAKPQGTERSGQGERTDQGRQPAPARDGFTAQTVARQGPALTYSAKSQPPAPSTPAQAVKPRPQFVDGNNLSAAASDPSYLGGRTDPKAPGSPLGARQSGIEALNSKTAGNEWPHSYLAKDPEIAATLRNGGEVKFQVHEKGILVELPGGRVQAFGRDPVTRVGAEWPTGRIDAPANVPPAGQPGMVTTANGHFTLDGQPFRHVGANVSQLMYEHPDRVWDELSRLKEAGVKDVRVFLPNSGLSKEEVGNRLQTMLDMAEKQGMKVTVSLTHFARQEFYTGTDGSNMGGHNDLENSGKYGGPFQLVKGDEKYAEWLYKKDASGNILRDENGRPKVEIGHPVLNNEWLRNGYKENYKPFVEYMVDRFKDHKGLQAWEVANETKSYSNPPDYGAVKSFYSDMVATIRAKDKNHLVTAGLTNSREFVGPDENERRRFLAQFDFVSIHQYNRDLPDDIHTDIRLAKELGKPAVLSEFGFFPTDNRPQATMPEVRQYVEQAYRDLGVDSVMPWASGYYNNPQEAWWKSQYGDQGMNDFYAVLRDANREMEEWNASQAQ